MDKTTPQRPTSTSLHRLDGPIELIELDGHAPSSSIFHHSSSSETWHPKVTPYRLITLLTTICLGTAKAVAVQEGSQNEPITLEWVTGIVVFLVLFNFGTYEDRPSHHIPNYLSWLFKPDCMDVVWWLISIIYPSFTRPNYISTEARSDPETAYVVTTYRLLVSTTVFTFGLLKASLTYSGISTGANWIEWILGVVITSILYIIGLYENNSAQLLPSFFGKDRAYIVRNGLNSSFKLIAIGSSLTIMSFWFVIDRPKDYRTEVELPFILKGYNSSTGILVEGAFIFFFLLGAVFLYSTIRSLVEDYRAHISPVLLQFFDRVDTVMSRIARAPFRWFLHYAYMLRHSLTLLLVLAFYISWLSFTFGYIYRAATSDPSLTIPAKWNSFLYFSMAFASLAPMAILFMFIRWAWRGLMGEIRYGTDRFGVLAIRRLLRLEAERIHYAFIEFSESLYGSLV
ncbi:hypothetical protein BDN70DRAFT_877179 [Pholiota conissans]|uniref:Uncharacterized protein n=1 Tax=Pholiota conissans TaxID=109636 RepID=A0A9P6CUM8_9AGAR|nr:hypothetical protein BDN70DRAFT_877179 [Pholiota conissans]